MAKALSRQTAGCSLLTVVSQRLIKKPPGIAGYTLIYDSHSLNLAEHKPFIAGESEHTPEIHMVERLDRRANISDTDKGRELLLQINDLRDLLDAYRSGDIKEGYKVF